MKLWPSTSTRIKLRNWEYWPSKAFYYPIAPYLIWLMIKARHMCYWSAVNPGIYTAGMGMESKFETLQLLPEPYRPKSVFLPAGISRQEAEAQLQAGALTFPLIVKPDLGFRGLLVNKVADTAALMQCLRAYDIPFIAQEYIGLPEEVGVLYYRMPGEDHGHITSVTTKEFLHVTGDGQATVLELVLRSPRALLQLERIRERYPQHLHQTPATGERVRLGIVGNHAKGTRFINSNALVNPQMVQVFDRISAQIEGFYYGRFDLKCQSLDSLYTGEGLKILEVNGVCSEPTHIYDPQRGTYWAALRDLAKHWRIIYQIAKRNRRNGVPVLSHAKTARAFLDLFAYQRRVR
ncbi:MAG: hypothetical protein RIC19_04615 [Phaeodactylibacter sp.]|uniref:hypothetical protein n=1 Tax=Phaeodactylibacter sp. TaxID=1940289 RepID=UPI0032EAB17B